MYKYRYYKAMGEQASTKLPTGIYNNKVRILLRMKWLITMPDAFAILASSCCNVLFSRMIEAVTLVICANNFVLKPIFTWKEIPYNILNAVN